LGADAFDLAAFYAQIDASIKERNAVRQGLVRGLKEYYEAAYGYDRYGAETIFRLGERMNEPHIYGFAARRILHDRRISTTTKVLAAEHALDLMRYGDDSGLPYGMFGIAAFLLAQSALSVKDLRYVLVVSAGENNPFRGLDKADAVDFFTRLLRLDDMPPVEQSFWAHSLVARHQDQPGAAELAWAILATDRISVQDRRELCNAWINFRQPRLMVDMPMSDGSPRSAFVANHLPFWVAHVASWPSGAMIRCGLTWLARHGEDPLQLAQTFLSYRETYADQFYGAVADILSEHHATIPDAQLRSLVEVGIRMTGSVPTRRRFYRLGIELFGSEYLSRASDDSASSVRQWAARQLHRTS
jgi:hypothetical protein